MTPNTAPRVEWVDLTKGLTILLVVIMHSTYGVEQLLGVEGWMHHVMAFATPFRMPVFFAVAGLFATSAISKDWRTFTDSKLFHFAYFYFLWLTIQFAFKAPFIAEDIGASDTLLLYFTSFVQPFGPLWFIYLLPFYFLALRVTSKVPMVAQFALAIAAKYAFSHTGISVIDYFSKYYVFFLAGHFGREIWFRLAEAARTHKGAAIVGFAAWALVNAGIVYFDLGAITPITIIMGILGFMAIVDLMAILPERGLAQILRFCGQRSLPIYLGFFLPMGVSRLIMTKLCAECSAGLIAFTVSLVSILGAIAMYEMVKRLPIGSFLYNRPQWARLGSKRSRLMPAE